MRTPRRILLSLFAVLAAAPAASANEIVLKDGTTLRVQEVLEATVERVAFKQAGSRQTRPAAEVEAIYPSGDSYLERAIRLLRKGDEDPRRIKETLDKAAGGRNDWAKPYAAFFLGELYERFNRPDDAVETYDRMAREHKEHFYAPVALLRAADLLEGDAAVERLERLASGDYGAAWKDAGEYGKARLLLDGGDHAGARPVFARLASGAKDEGLRELAACGEAHAQLLGGDARKAEQTFKGLREAKSSAVKGYAWTGLGLCWQEAQPDKALVALLRGILLYPSNPQRGAATRAAAALAQRQQLADERRVLGYAKGRLPFDDYAGDQPVAELMRRTMPLSARLVMKLAPILVGEAKGDEQAELEFIGADALKAVARANNDADMLAEYEAKLKELRKKYPNHGRAALAGIDGFIAAKDRALAIIGQAGEATDPARKQELLTEGRALFDGVLEPFKENIGALTARVNELLTKEENGDASEEEEQERHETEYRRDLSEFLLAEAYASYAKTFPDKSEEQQKVYREALKGYDHYIDDRGSDVRWLWYSYVGRAETYMSLGEYQEAAFGFEELTVVEWPYPLPDDPEVQKNIKALVQEVCIRGYHGAVRALLLAGKPQEAFSKSQEIDDNPKAEGWRDHPMGILLTFERAKALAGAGQGAQGARELYRIVVQAQNAPEAEKIPGLGMSREGAGAARALSELSDLTGGEIYTPEIQYYVGVGYYLRQETELAVAGYKGVLTAARTKKERALWVPKAVKEIGNLLFTQDRFLEAALAYQTVFTEFPEDEFAEEAVRFAVSASKKAIVQFGEDPTDRDATMVKFSASIAKGAGEAAGPLYEYKLWLNTAKDYHTKQKWLAAAQEYLKIPPTYTDPKTKETLRVPFYANAVANGGYCYFKAFGESNDEAHLNLARDSLRKAAQVSAEQGDRESQGLACFYLGQLELEMGQAAAALEALGPFDGPLAGTSRIVRARYQQAMAHLELGGEEGARNAEAAFRKVEDRAQDDFYEEFAYRMAIELRQVGNALFKESGDYQVARRHRAKAAQYARRWARATNLDEARGVVLIYLGDVLFEGGLYADALQLYDRGLADLEARAREDMGTAQQLDLVNISRGYCMAQTGKLQEAFDTLEAVRKVAYVYDANDGMVRRAVLKERKLEGRKWYTILDEGGTEVKYFDPPAAVLRGDESFPGIPVELGDGWTKKDVCSIDLELKRQFFVVDALEAVTWKMWEQDGDKNFLATRVTEACNDIRYVLHGMTEASYERLLLRSQYEPADLELRRWQSDLRFLRIKLARENWREVLSDLQQMELLKKVPPDALKGEFEAIKQEAESRS